MKKLITSILLILPMTLSAQTPVSVEVKEAAQTEKKTEDLGERIVLKDGRVFRVFSKKPTTLPPKGEIYVDRASFNKMLAEEKKIATQSSPIEIVVQDQDAAVVTQEVEELPKIVEEKKEGIVLKSVKTEEEDPVHFIKEEAIVPLSPVANPTVVAQEPAVRTPISVEVRQKMEEIFDAGVTEGQVLTDEKTRLKVEEEKRLLAKEIQRNEDIKAQARLAEQEQTALSSMQEKEKDLRQNAQLSEGTDEFSAPADKEELKVVNLSKKNVTVPVEIPQPLNQDRQNTVVLLRNQSPSPFKFQDQDEELLHEGFGLEEANGPEYGFGFEK